MTSPLRHEPIEHVAAPATPPLHEVERPASRIKTWMLVVLAGAGISAALLVTALLQSVVVTDQHRIDTIKQQTIEEEHALQNERVALAAAQSPVNIAERAKALGMVEADSSMVITAAPTDASNRDDAGTTATTAASGTDRNEVAGAATSGAADR
jgi:hypothetical protein